MKTITFLILPLLFVISFSSFGINYTINFTGSGVSTTVDDVIVQNLTQGTSVTVPSGNVLRLLDTTTSVESLKFADEAIHIYPNSDGKSMISFFSKQAGETQINVVNIAGMKIAGLSIMLQSGINSFQLSPPNGVSIIQVLGNNYSYSTKILNQINTTNKLEIKYVGIQKIGNSGIQKVKNSETTMLYTSGDQLIFKAISGNFSTIVADIPTESKTINFDFTACVDADGNNYTTVLIGSQTWMAENLKTTKFNDNSDVPLVTLNTAWNNLSTPGYSWYNNDETTYKNKYGALYNWYAVNAGNLAPTGWHVPSDAEYTTLTTYLGGLTVTGGKLKEKGILNWTTPNTGATNQTGFTALPSGYRNVNGTYANVNSTTLFWSTTPGATIYAYGRRLDFNQNAVTAQSYQKVFGFSVRCIKD